MTDTPLLDYKNELSFTLARAPSTVEEQKQYWDALATSFMTLFRCNPTKFYILLDEGEKNYTARQRTITPEDWIAHLWNMPDADLVLSPIGLNNEVYWCAIDIDRHGEEQEPVQWSALAQRVSEENLPLVVCESARHKGAHLFLFFRERENGVPAADAIRIMQHYVKILGLPDATEIFPKQSQLAEGEVGNGINVPYHFRKGSPGYTVNNPVAYDAEGNPLEHWEDFLDFAYSRSKFGNLLLRDLPGETPAVTSKKTTAADRPIKAAEARLQYAASLDTLRSAPLDGNGNALLNKTAFFAGSVLKALGKTGEDVKTELLHIVTKEWKSPHNASKASATIDSGLTKGISEPRAVVLPPVLPWRDSSEQITVAKSPSIIDRLIYSGVSTVLLAKPKVGKTTFLLDACECILYGRSFLKEEVVQGNVLFISEQPLGSFVAEMINSGLQTTGQLATAPDAPKGKFHFITVEDWYGHSWADIVEATVAHAVQIDAKLVCFDTLSRIARVEDENSASQMQAAVDLLVPFYANGIATLISQHERKSGGSIEDSGRGTSALAGSVDVLLRLTRSGGTLPGSYRNLEFLGRFPGPSEPRVLDRKTAGPGSRYEMMGDTPGVKSANAQSIITGLFPADDHAFMFSEEQITAGSNLDRTSVYRAIEKLVEDGTLVRTGHGVKGDPFLYYRKEPPF
jgi:hypothetical protein